MPQAPVYAGTSGWAYASWKPGFYPAEVPAKRFLEHFATRLNAVEVNYTFRALPTAAMLAGWLAATPADFRFSFKAPQAMTHFKRLVECGDAVARFSAALEPVRAAGRLGPLLFQLPPNFKVDVARLEGLLRLPELSGPGAAKVAFEFRHESWFAEPVYEVLRAHGAALCLAEGDELSTPEVQCAEGFACYRLRRSGGYTAEEIGEFAERFGALAKTREVYAFFRHEDEPTGARNAEALLRACAGAERR
ncbi:MAG: DUF72 domain-containing protein [Acidobacteriota bacterium]|nr:DUF72 domain-containing protein [Acidobacteriota bacterium]